jgi:phospholipase/carboxylesterase
MQNQSIQNFAGLECLVFDTIPADRAPTQLVVICHGFGASKDDLATFAPYLMQADAAIADSCRFVFPNAPMDLTSLGMPGGRAWWEINMSRLAQMHQTKNYEELTTMTPPGLLEASEQLATAVREMQQAYGLDDAATTLAGFSQGAMISTDLVLRHGFTPRQLCVFSGSILCRDDWTAFAAKHPGCPVLQSHGTVDMVLPFEPAEGLRDMLQDNGFDVTFHSFYDGHTVPVEILNEVGVRLAKV